MTTEVVWTQKERILDFISQYGDNFARCKLDQEVIDELANALGKLENSCFRNCLLTAHGSADLFDYCEGFAIIDGHYYPHAWLFPKEIYGDKNQYWCIDPTYPWLLENFNDNRPLDKITYIGVRFNPDKTLDKLKKLNGNYSILKFFDKCNLMELLS